MTSVINRRSAAMSSVSAADTAEAAMYKCVGDRIRASRINQGYHIDELAAKACLNPIELGAMEAGLGRVPSLKLVAIANALDVHLATLFGARASKGETAGRTAPTQSEQPSGEVARIARAYDLIRDPTRRNMLLTFSELLADESEVARADVTH